jgi:hypothetical protein
MSKIGSLVFLKIGTDELVGETSVSFASASDAIDVSSKVSGRDTNVEYGRMNRTISVSGIASTDNSASGYGLKSALDAQSAGTKVSFIITEFSDKTAATPVSGAIKIEGTECGVITNVNFEAGDNAANTFSMDLQIDGTVTVGVND